MTISQILFIVISLVVLAGGVMVVTARNLFHAALFLIASFFGVVGLYLLLDAGFFAAAQFLVYIGAISILVIFAVMLTRGSVAAPPANSQWPAALAVSVIVFAILALTVGPVALTIAQRQFGNVSWPNVTPGQPVAPVPDDSLVRLGQSFVDFNQYGALFLLTAVLILVAMVGAIWVARDRTLRDVIEERAELAAEEAQEAMLAVPTQQPSRLAEAQNVELPAAPAANR
ncbi:MAG: NADH-quinone oxidoreductase subunit J family protein [Candidatus Roseilinea sp.]|uniref:NADH-quinone oxidoreductase subunit J family protein n=1 Tax=Candidatus Roseilinea sp. TaxID=2838777 RepID=UPI00404977C2